VHPDGVLTEADTWQGWTIQTRFTGRSDAPDGPCCFWQVTATHPLLDQGLKYDLPSRQAADMAHAILRLLVWKEAFKEKVRSVLLGER
jgi:hypothetical protein